MLYAKDFRRIAWQSLAGYWGTAVVVILLYSLIISAAASTVIGGILISGPLWIGYTSFCLGQVRGMRPGVNALFEGFSRCFVGSIAAYLLTGLFTFLWSLLLVVPGIIKTYSYAMVPYILADHPDMDVLSAIDESRYLMDGNKWRLFCLDMSFIGWILLCLVTFGIATFWVTPYQQCARAAFYESVKDKV